MCLGATDFALPAAVFCSLTNGVQKLEIFSYTEKFGLVILAILSAVKNIAMILKLKTFIKQVNRFAKLVSGTAAAACPTHYYNVGT